MSNKLKQALFLKSKFTNQILMQSLLIWRTIANSVSQISALKSKMKQIVKKSMEEQIIKAKTVVQVKENL